MADAKPKVYLGFEDEPITQKYQSINNYTTNKVGGKPDWINGRIKENPECQLCGLKLPLIVQIYAPLEHSPYHRTLYIFGCINPNCWNQDKSWVCLRSQLLDTQAAETVKKKSPENFTWCDGANDWEDEENGNFEPDPGFQQELASRMGAMDIEEVSPTGAVGYPLPPVASAEIEGDEGEVVSIDTPPTAQTDISALLDQIVAVPQVPSETLEFESFFLSVIEEDDTKMSHLCNLEFSQQLLTVDEESNSSFERQSETEACGGESLEKYEKSLPVHGDRFFHQFISRIQRNPGQILRYIREGGAPLLLYRPVEMPRRCRHCSGELVPELQLVPTLLSRLTLANCGTGHLEFGTVLLLTCRRSCWAPGDSLRSEHVIVQLHQLNIEEENIVLENSPQYNNLY